MGFALVIALGGGWRGWGGGLLLPVLLAVSGGLKRTRDTIFVSGSSCAAAEEVQLCTFPGVA